VIGWIGKLRRFGNRGKMLYIGVSTVLTVMASPAASQAQITFTNNTPLSIPGTGTLGPANPYPSRITVSGLIGSLTGITVALTGYSHTFTDDVGALLVGPQGQKTLLFDGAGSSGATNLTLVFDDAALAPLPNQGTFGSGTYQPGQNQFGDAFSTPAPAGPYASTFSAFVGSNPNGNFDLYIQDFIGDDAGTLASWSVTLHGVNNAAPEPNSILLVIAGMGVFTTFRRKR
jgi:hypothetical protein